MSYPDAGMDAVLIAGFCLWMDGYGVIDHCADYRGAPWCCGRGLVWLAFAVGASLQPLRLTLRPCLAGFSSAAASATAIDAASVRASSIAVAACRLFMFQKKRPCW